MKNLYQKGGGLFAFIFATFFCATTSPTFAASSKWNVAIYCETGGLDFSKHSDEFQIVTQIGCYQGGKFDSRFNEYLDADVICIGGSDDFSTTTAQAIEDAVYNDGKILMVNFWSDSKFGDSLPAMPISNANYGPSIVAEDRSDPIVAQILAGVPDSFDRDSPDWIRRHTEDKPGATVITRFSLDNSPALVVWRYGKGTVIYQRLEMPGAFYGDYTDQIAYQALKWALGDVPELFDDFEGYTQNTWPSPNWVGFRGNDGSDPSNNCVVVDPTNDNNKVLKLFGVLGGCWGAGAEHQCSFPTQFIVQFKVYNGSETLTGCHPHRADIGMKQGTYWTNPGRGLILFRGNGNVTAADGTILQTYQTERWYDVKIHYQRIERNLTLRYWIDDIYRGQVQLTVDDIPREESFDHFQLVAQEGTAYFDDVCIIPGPPTLGPYVICVSESTYQDPSWQTVVDALQSKHGASIITYSGIPFPHSVRTTLSQVMPRYVCFVATVPELTQLGETYVRQAHQLTRALDADPYGDCLWGIITGCEAADALRMVQADPLTVRKGLLKTAGGWLEYLPEGIYHSESENDVMWVKPYCGPIDKTQPGPYDDTCVLVDELNTNTVDIMVTSGHATQYEWQLHYPTPDGEGFFRTDNCQLYGIDANGIRCDINSTNPKIYYAPGNCLIGKVSGNNSMVPGWLHTGGAVQYCGYVVSTWFGYMGWGVSDYFFKLQDQFTFAEAFFLTNQALLFDLENNTPGINPTGLAYDRDVLAFYGDPGYTARIESCPGTEPIYGQTLTYTETTPGYYQFTMTVHLNSAINVSKPVIAFLPFRVTDVTVISNSARAIEITDDMAMMQLWTEGDPDLQAEQNWEIVFIARQLTAMSKWRFAGDINRDGVVNLLDFAFMAANWLEDAGQ